MRRWGAKRDSNEQPIVTALRKAGYTVYYLNQPALPDLLVCRKGRKNWVLLEVKTETGELEDLQLQFFQDTEGTMRFLVRSAEQALNVCKNWIDLTHTGESIDD